MQTTKEYSIAFFLIKRQLLVWFFLLIKNPAYFCLSRFFHKVQSKYFGLSFIDIFLQLFFLFFVSF